MIEIENRLFERLISLQFANGTELICHLFAGDYSKENEFLKVISPFELPKYLQKRFANHYEKNTRLTNFEEYTLLKKRSDIIKINLATAQQANDLIKKLLNTLD